MPGLIQRYNAVAEYSALISTHASPPPRTGRHRGGNDDLSSPFKPRSPRTVLREEASEWYEALAPPLEDLQAVIRRMQADPDLTQDHVFAHLCPAAVLCALFVVALVAARQDSYVHRMLDSPSLDGCCAAIARFAAVAVCAVVVSVVALKCVIYGVAEACALVLAMETGAKIRAREERGVPTSNLVLGGMML